MKKSGLVLFFTDRRYRWATIGLWKMKFFNLPGIRHIISWWHELTIARRMRKMSSWEQHLYVKKIEYQAKKCCFSCALVNLLGYITAEGEERNDKGFLEAKQDLLENEYINSSEMREFKEWLEEATPDETDYTQIKVVMEMLSKAQ